MLRKINKREHDTYRLQASLHGIQLPDHRDDEGGLEDKTSKLTPEQETAIAQRLAETQEKLKARFKPRGE